MSFPCRSSSVSLPFSCFSPAVPLSSRSAKDLDCLIPIDLHSAALFDSHIPCHSPAVPLPCHEYALHGRFVAGSRHADVMRTACELNVNDLPAVGFFLLTRGVPGSLFSEAGEW